MAKAGLTSRFRPQLFAEVAGQDFIKTILSRTAARDCPAHAYLFSGTRGVGKTTVARILAKAVNCRNGPGPEPCNECDNCDQITRGAFPDVWEIDGASHTGVDHVRKLREDVVYTPMSGRYKVVIIDEAHMLSQSAFNALLKTLEEPPRHCVFIMATTVREKFPVTVLSRCQHYVFKRLTQKELSRHLEFVLRTENISYQEEAVQLLARRGAGSVRDSMSMLGQVLALGDEGLQTANVREVLGLADQEVFRRLMQNVLERDLPGLYEMVRYLLEQGLDLGFFLQELAQCWRNLFLLSRGGEEAGKLLDLDPEEIEHWTRTARKLPAPQIHAGWQMVLEGRRSILDSYEPGLSLELLLYSLAYLSELVPVAEFEPANPDFKAPSNSSAEKETADKNSGAKIHGGQCGNTGNKEITAPEVKKDILAREDVKKNAGPEPLEGESLKDFLDFCVSSAEEDRTLSRMLGHCRARIEQDRVVLSAEKDFVRSNLERNGRMNRLALLAGRYFSRNMRVEFEDKGLRQHSRVSPEQKVHSHPGVKKLITEFEARIMEVSQTQPKHKQ